MPKLYKKAGNAIGNAIMCKKLKNRKKAEMLENIQNKARKYKKKLKCKKIFKINQKNRFPSDLIQIDQNRHVSS